MQMSKAHVIFHPIVPNLQVYMMLWKAMICVMGMKTTKSIRFYNQNKNKCKLNFKFKLWNKKNKNKNMTCAK